MVTEYPPPKRTLKWRAKFYWQFRGEAPLSWIVGKILREKI